MVAIDSPRIFVLIAFGQPRHRLSIALKGDEAIRPIQTGISERPRKLDIRQPTVHVALTEGPSLTPLREALCSDMVTLSSEENA